MQKECTRHLQDRCILIVFFQASGTHGVRICSGPGEKEKILIVKKEAAGTKPTAQDLQQKIF
jgi:hypothetical protein